MILLPRFSLCSRRSEVVGDTHHECKHGSKKYECFPPYAAPGGLRERIFHRSTPKAQYRNAIEFLAANKAKPPGEDPFSCYSELEASKVSLVSSMEVSEHAAAQESLQDEDRRNGGVLIYHESARSIVFRDHVRRASKQTSPDNSLEEESSFKIVNYQPEIKPLEQLGLGRKDEFAPLIQETVEEDLTPAEMQVFRLLETQHACVKTIKNSEWTDFFNRFHSPVTLESPFRPPMHADIAPHGDYSFNSFVTSTSLLPSKGLKMRTYGSPKEYTIGAVFALPQTNREDMRKSQTWAWPAGYAAKTEFNIDHRGRLINGREQALVSLHDLRQQNHDFLYKAECKLLGRMINFVPHTVPYNEVFLRVGGVGRMVANDESRSLEKGVGLPVALFARSYAYGHLIALLRTRARAMHVFKNEMEGLPLLVITPELGVRVLTSTLERKLLQIAARDLNPFQNHRIAYKTCYENTTYDKLQEKVLELLDLDSENMRQALTYQERAHLAGGFGATDESIVSLLREAKQNHFHLPDLVNEGFEYALRSNDYHTARQLLILYSFVASDAGHDDNAKVVETHSSIGVEVVERPGMETKNVQISSKPTGTNGALLDKQEFVSPPPPLDTDKLRAATSSDGLLVVLGAAQVLRSMRDGGAKKRAKESFAAIEEWVYQGEHSVAFRLASWRDQHAAQTDLEINMQNETNVLAFVSNKALLNRKNFCSKLKAAVTNYESMKFLHVIYEILCEMNNPCLRLELLQFIFCLDNRFSIAHIKESVELAATCLVLSCK